MKLSEKLQMLRRRARMSQQELAERIGSYQTRISEWENAEESPDLPARIVLQLARVFSVPYEYLADDAIESPTPTVTEEEARVIRFLRRKGIEADDAIAALAIATAAAAGPAEVAGTRRGASAGLENVSHQATFLEPAALSGPARRRRAR